MSAENPGRPLGSDARSVAALFVAVLLSVAPAMLVRIPPVLDYPNHYVRLWLLTGGVDHPPLSRIYAVDWSRASANMAMDWVAVGLSGIVPAGIAAASMLALAIALPPLGLALLGRRVFGAFHWWHVACFVLAWNWVLLAGFVDFEIALGLALVGAALDLRLAKHGPAALVPLRIAVGGVVFAAHAFGFLFYAALLCGLALGPTLAPLLSPGAAGRAALRAVLACLPLAAPVLLLLVLAPTLAGETGDAPPSAIVLQERSVFAYASMLLTGLKTYRFSVDIVFGLLLALPVLAALLLRRLRVHAGLAVTGVVLTVGAILVPRVILDSHGIETRLPCMVALTFAVAVLPDLRLPRRWAAMAAAVAALVVAARAGWIGYVWLDRQSDVASVDRALAHVPPGAAVLPLEHLPAAADIARAPLGRFFGSRTPTYWHYPTLAIMGRRAFVPHLFTAAGKQPLRVLPPWDSISVPDGPLAPVDKLGDPSTLAGPYLGRWRECFDYILVVNADMPNAGGPLPASPAIAPVADEGFARLYRISRPGAGPAACG